MCSPISNPQQVNCAGRGGFTLAELLVVMAVIGILAGLLLPALGASRGKARGIFCQNNNKQLATGWLMYADDHSQRLAYNLGGAATRTNLNWAAGVLDWELTPDNTNLAELTEAALGSYVAKESAVYRCPSDSVRSAIQAAAGWSRRARSYSMNAAVGDAGEISRYGVNTNNPGYTQFFKLTSMPAPARIFVFRGRAPRQHFRRLFCQSYLLPGMDPPARIVAQCGGHLFLRRRAHRNARLEMRQHHAGAGPRRGRAAH